MKLILLLWNYGTDTAFTFRYIAYNLDEWHDMISFQKNVIMAMECVGEKKESSITSTLCFADGVQHIQAHCTQIAEHIKYNK